MPTISQLPAATSISASDALPISQGGNARSASVGALLASVQPVVIVDSPSLIGRTSLGAGGPEQVDVGTGLLLTQGSLVANGLDHNAFPYLDHLTLNTALVGSDQNNPVRVPPPLLRGLFTAGQNVVISPDGVISATSPASNSSTGSLGSAIGNLQTLSSLSAQDLVAVSHNGVDASVTYANLLAGVTIDQAQTAVPASDSDTIWVAQGSNIMLSQRFSAIWSWMANKIPTYKLPTVEVTTNINLDTTIHNGRILICSQPVLLTPLIANMGNGFSCTAINASSGNVTLGTGFISSSGNLNIGPGQSASLYSVTYSGGAIAFATVSGVATTASVVNLPGPTTSFAASAATSTTITLVWQAPVSGNQPMSYAIQSRVTGTQTWSSSTPITGSTTYQMSGLLPATSYDFTVNAQNSAGVGPVSSVLTVTTAGIVAPVVPLQVTGLVATPVSSTSIRLNWSPLANSVSFTVNYRSTGSTTWTGSVTLVPTNTTVITGLQVASQYDFMVFGVGANGSGVNSTVVSASTQAASELISSIVWNLLPTGPYVHASGAIGVNARVTPSTSPIQFGFSTSVTTPPTNWISAILVNSNLWGAYVPTPPSAGTWYAWAEGLDGSNPTVSSSPFTVQ